MRLIRDDRITKAAGLRNCGPWRVRVTAADTKLCARRVALPQVCGARVAATQGDKSRARDRPSRER